MSTVKIAIVEDITQDRLQLQHMVISYLEQQQLRVKVEEYASGKEFCRKLQETEFDIVFLDIYLGVENGMEIAKKIRQMKQESMIVFVTSSRDHAIEGYQVRAFQYLVKPVEEDDVHQVMELCRRTLLKNSKYICIVESGKNMQIMLSNIISAMRDHHYVEIDLGSTRIRVRMALSAFESVLDERFVSCNRQEIVNMDYVDRLFADHFLMQNGRCVQIPQRNYERVQGLFFDHVLQKEWGRNM